jgi:hypothetical protein
MTTAEEYAHRIMAEIHKDLTEDFPWGAKLPRDVGSFSALHDYCDANMYLLVAVDEVDTYEAETETEEHYALVNAIMAEVDKRLADEAKNVATD